MTRTGVLLLVCSTFLAAGWLLVSTDDAGLALSEDTKFHASGAGMRAVAPALHGSEDGNRELQAVRKIPAKKKMGVRGVSVDRKNIVEEVTLEDLMAPPGRLWIPAAVSGPVDQNLPDPLFNVLVAYCQLDMSAYHAQPWLFAMGTFHQRQSGCLEDQSLVRTYRITGLMRILEENPDAFMDPTGFIYHETRCGSTLTANMMASIPTNIVHSETPPPIAVFNLCTSSGKCSSGLRKKLVRSVFRLMGPVQDGHTNLFFKFQSSKFLPAVEEIFPDVKWIYLFRDPLEVISSNLKGAWRKVGLNAAGRNGTGPAYNVGGPCVRGVKGAAKVPGGKMTPPSPETLLDACAKQLESLNEVALNQISKGSPNGLAVEYRQLPEVISEYVYPTHFGMANTDEERQEFQRYMEPVTHVYSKGMATPQEEAVSKEFEQGMDLETKEKGSDEAMRTTAGTMCENYLALVRLQRWHKEDEGGTMGTCSTR